MEYRKRRIIIQNLKSKGFIEERDRDHIVLKFFNDGVYAGIRTKLSHGSKSAEIDEELISRMAKQCKVTKKQFVGLVECTVSQADYLAMVSDHFKLSKS